jgi:hypothetical protein
VKKALTKAEDEIAKLSSAAATEADATTELAPKAKKIFDESDDGGAHGVQCASRHTR